MRIVVRFRRARSLLRRYVGISIGVHAAAVVVLFFLPYLRPKADLIPMDAAFVELTGPIAAAPAAAAAAPRPPAPSSPAVAEPEGPSAIEKVPEPTKKKDDKKRKEEPKKKEAPPPSAAATPAPHPPGPEAPAQDPAGPAGIPGGTGGAAGITALEGADPGLAWYNAAVAGALENAWMRPVLEGVGEVQSVIVSFEIGRDGNVFNLAVDAPSGIASLDRSALRAVQDAAPFPPPPQAARGSSVRQRIRFDLRPETR